MTKLQWEIFKARRANSKKYSDAFIGFVIVFCLTALGFYGLSLMTWLIF